MIRALVLAGVFLVSTVVFSFLTNKTNPDMTTELEEAKLPTVQQWMNFPMKFGVWIPSGLLQIRR